MKRFRACAASARRPLTRRGACLIAAVVLASFGRDISLAQTQTQPSTAEVPKARSGAQLDIFSDRSRSGPRCPIPGPCGRCDCPPPHSVRDNKPRD
jgi:hypothetical protein